MFRLRPIFLAIACCLTLVGPAQASALLEGIGPKCGALQEKLLEMSDADQLPGEDEPGFAMCVAGQALAPRAIDAPFSRAAEVHSLPGQTRPAIAILPSGIERPPRA